MQESVYERMEQMRASATKSEQIIIDKIITINANEIIYQSITELSENIGSSEATLLRFCRKIGFKGFQDFKLMLSQDIVKSEIVCIGDECTHNKISAHMCHSISETEKYIKYDEFLKVAKKIVNSKRVCAFGVGSSAIATKAMKLRLAKAGINIEDTNDNHVQTVITANLNEDDLIIFVSVSGSTKDIIKLAEIACSNNVDIVVITNYFKSPLARFATHLFYSSKKESPFEGGSLVTVVSQSYLVDVLCTAVFEQLGVQGEISSIKTSTAVSDKLL